MTALVLALLFAQAPAADGAPHRLVIVAKEPPRAPLWGRLEALTARLFEKPDPQVAKGNALAAGQDAQGALEQYDAAREKHPDDPALAHDRATSLLKLGHDKAAEALAEGGRAQGGGSAELKSLGAYDQALALEQLGKPDEAMQAYARALALNPDDVDAKVNLELLLQQKEQKKQQPQAGQKNDEQKQQPQDQNQEQKKEQQGKEQKPDEQKQQAGEKKEEQKEPPKEQQAQQQQPQEKPEQPRQGQEKPVDRTEAQRLLDALKAGEKNLQVWRFAKQNKKETRRPDVEKDW